MDKYIKTELDRYVKERESFDNMNVIFVAVGHIIYIATLSSLYYLHVRNLF